MPAATYRNRQICTARKIYPLMLYLLSTIMFCEAKSSCKIKNEEFLRAGWTTLNISAHWMKQSQSCNSGIWPLLTNDLMVDDLNQIFCWRRFQYLLKQVSMMHQRERAPFLRNSFVQSANFNIMSTIWRIILFQLSLCGGMVSDHSSCVSSNQLNIKYRNSMGLSNPEL